MSRIYPDKPMNIDWKDFTSDPPIMLDKAAFQLNQAIAKSNELMKQLEDIEKQRQEIQARLNHTNGVIRGIKIVCTTIIEKTEQGAENNEQQ